MICVFKMWLMHNFSRGHSPLVPWALRSHIILHHFALEIVPLWVEMGDREGVGWGVCALGAETPPLETLSCFKLALKTLLLHKKSVQSHASLLSISSATKGTYPVPVCESSGALGRGRKGGENTNGFIGNEWHWLLHSFVWSFRHL